MLVRFPQALVITEYFNYDRFGEIVLALPLDGEPRPFTARRSTSPGARRTPARSRTASAGSRSTTTRAPRTPVLRHPNGARSRWRTGSAAATPSQNAVGVLGFDFSLYRILPTGPADYTAANPRPPAPEAVGGSLRVAAMNTLNFFLTLDTTASDTGRRPVRRQRQPRLPRRRLPTSRDEFTRQRTSCCRRSPASTPTCSGSTSSRTRRASTRSPTSSRASTRSARHVRPHRHRHHRHRRDQGRPDLQARRGHAGRRLPDPRLQRRPAVHRHEEPARRSPRRSR